MLISTNCGFGYEYNLNTSTFPNVITNIQYDDSTGAILNTSSLNTSTGFSSPLAGLSTVSPSQLAELAALEEQLKNKPVPEGYSSWDEFKTDIMGKLLRGELPEGYDSWEEYKDSLLNTVSLNTSTTGGASASVAANPMYNRYQDALMVLPTAIQTAGYTNQLNSYDEAFHNMDMQMMMPYKQRMAYRFANQYALVDNSEHLPSKYQPTIIYSQVQRAGGTNGFWLRPYVSTGSINFKNGPKAYSTLYGAFLGADSSIKHLSKSDFQYSIYVGYNGSHESYGHNSVDSNGGMLGLTGTWYGKNSFASLTINAGATNAELHTQFMNREYPMFATGVAAKTGYNFEFADGKFIIQPNYLMSYSFVTPFEKGSVAGMNIESKPLNALNISPGIKFIGNLGKGWQPYAEARMVWNLFNKTEYSTAMIDIPSISMKPYAQYGFGIQKLWGERSTGFIQFMMRSGGRNDVAFSAGYRYDLGDL